MVFFVLNPKKGVFYESLLSKMAKRDRLCYSVCSSGYIGIPMRTLFFWSFCQMLVRQKMAISLKKK